MAWHGVVEIDREGFMEVIKLDPSSSLVSMCLSAVVGLAHQDAPATTVAASQLLC